MKHTRVELSRYYGKADRWDSVNIVTKVIAGVSLTTSERALWFKMCKENGLDPNY